MTGDKTCTGDELRKCLKVSVAWNWAFVCRCFMPAVVQCTQNKDGTSAEHSPLSFKFCQIFSIRKVGNSFYCARPSSGSACRKCVLCGFQCF
jgi:hypothetical protein